MIMHGEISMYYLDDEPFADRRFIPSTWNNGMVE